MATQRIIKDQDFGRIVIRTRRLARRISIRVRPDGLYLTVPPYSRTDSVLTAVSPFRDTLLESFRKVAPQRIDFSFAIQAECFRLSLVPSRLRCFTVREEGEAMKIFCPQETDFSQKGVQKLLREAVVRALKKRAASFLPPLVGEWAARYGLSYQKVRITGARTRWGSCTATGVISLSCYLMLLPSYLMDYVILHELAHTREMNHSPRFWTLLDQLTDGQALRLRAEMRNYLPNF